jgi:MFS family permease
MKSLVSNRQLRLLFAANLVSMFGSGMNASAVNWYILQTTHSEQLLGLLVVAQAVPSLLLMPFSGVVVDREDRRHVVMFLDAARALLILTVALLALHGSVRVWELYVMSILVSMGFWVFWPTITALLQELTPEAQFAESNAILLAGFQGGFLMSGAIVGFLYERIGIGGILLIDLSTYVFSFSCYLTLRKGRQTAAVQTSHRIDHPVGRFLHEAHEAVVFVWGRRSLAFMGLTWALFVAAMMVTTVVTAPISDRIIHAGAVGYGWMTAAWGIGAFASTFYAARCMALFGWRKTIPAAMLILAASLYSVPFSVGIAMAAGCYLVAGVGRGIGGIALSSSIMEIVPKHFMGRVSTLFSIAAIVLQVTFAPLVGHVAQNIGLAPAIYIIGSLYFLAATSGWLSGKTAAVTPEVSELETSVNR